MIPPLNYFPVEKSQELSAYISGEHPLHGPHKNPPCQEGSVFIALSLEFANTSHYKPTSNFSCHSFPLLSFHIPFLGWLLLPTENLCFALSSLVAFVFIPHKLMSVGSSTCEVIHIKVSFPSVTYFKWIFPLRQMLLAELLLFGEASGVGFLPSHAVYVGLSLGLIFGFTSSNMCPMPKSNNNLLRHPSGGLHFIRSPFRKVIKVNLLPTFSWQGQIQNSSREWTRSLLGEVFSFSALFLCLSSNCERSPTEKYPC